MKFIRSLPLMCARTRWPFSSSTANIVFGSGSMTVPSTSIASFFANLAPWVLLSNECRPGRADTRTVRISTTRSNPTTPRLVQTRVRISGPSAVTAIVCSKWAASEPSDRHDGPAVVAGPPSSSGPRVNIGSIAKQWPGAQLDARGRGSGSWARAGSSCIEVPMPWPDVLADDPVARAVATSSTAAEMSPMWQPRPRGGDAGHQREPGRLAPGRRPRACAASGRRR